jgi:hypothetical protein
MAGSRRFALALLVAAAAFAACDLNPQPLPPGDDKPENAAAPPPGDFGPGGSSGSKQDGPGDPGSDAGVNGDAAPPAPEDAGSDGGETDGGDAGDATSD